MSDYLRWHEEQREKAKETARRVLVGALAVFTIAVALILGLATRAATTAPEEPTAEERLLQEYDLNGDGEISIIDYTLNRLQGLRIRNIILFGTEDSPNE